MAVRPWRLLSVCAGVGGLDLGVRLAEPEARSVCYVEREAAAASILVARNERRRAAVVDRRLLEEIARTQT